MTPFQGFLVTLFRATPQRFARHVLACELLDSEAFVVVRPVSIAKSYRKFSVTCSWRAIMLSQGEIGDQIPLRNRIGETGEPYAFFEGQKWAGHGRVHP